MASGWIEKQLLDIRFVEPERVLLASSECQQTAVLRQQRLLLFALDLIQKFFNREERAAMAQFEGLESWTF